MTEKNKNLIKGIVVIITFTIVLCMVSKIFVLKSEDGYDQMRSYYKQKENTVDVLFLGSSKIHCQVDTGILWDNFGIAAFDLSGAEAPTWASYYYLREALKTQTPKVIVYDASLIGFKQDVLSQPSVWSIVNNYGMKWNSNRILQLKANTVNNDEFKKLLFPLDTMHSRYGDLSKIDFKDVNDDISYKGFDYRDTVREFETPTAINITDEMPVNEKHIDYLLRMNEYAKEKNVPFIVMISPYVLSDEEQMYFNYVKRICEENGIDFYDLNQKYDEIGIDFSTDMAEAIHLNFSGTKKFSEYLGNMLNKEFDIPDRRGDKNYSSWNKDALINRQQRIKYDFNHTEDETVKEEIKKNENYIVFAVYEDGSINITNGESVIFTSSEEEYRGFIDEDDMKILFERKNGYTVLYINENQYTFDGCPELLYDRVLKEVIN